MKKKWMSVAIWKNNMRSTDLHDSEQAARCVASRLIEEGNSLGLPKMVMAVPVDDENTIPDQQRGMYPKFLVLRMDGSSAKGQKHEKCFNFVLDIEHDKFAAMALVAYAQACAKEYPQLSIDIQKELLARVPDIRQRIDREHHSQIWQFLTGKQSLN